MPENNKGTTYSFDVCSQCKIICCQDAKPPLTEKRKKIITRYIKNQNIKIEKPFAKESYSYPAVDEHIFCTFLDKSTHRCTIHAVKPETCVAGPVTFDINFGTKKIQWFLKKNEICQFAGQLFNDQAAFKEHLGAAKKELTQLICNLDPEELRALMKIDEPETFQVGEDDLPDPVIKKLGLK